MGKGLASESPWVDGGLCSGTGKRKLEGRGARRAWYCALGVSEHGGETRRGSLAGEGHHPAPLGSPQLQYFTGVVPRLSSTATLLHPGLGEGGGSP